jgi:hypothetical protein
MTTTAALVNITCEGCGQTSTVPVDALLVSVAVDDTMVDDTGFEAADEPGADTTAAIIAWTCESCADLVTSWLDWMALLTLVTAGATLLDDASDSEDLPPHPEHPAGGTPLSRDDLLSLHELLASDSWFDQVASV